MNFIQKSRLAQHSRALNGQWTGHQMKKKFYYGILILNLLGYSSNSISKEEKISQRENCSVSREIRTNPRKMLEDTLKNAINGTNSDCPGVDINLSNENTLLENLNYLPRVTREKYKASGSLDGQAMFSEYRITDERRSSTLLGREVRSFRVELIYVIQVLPVQNQPIAICEKEIANLSMLKSDSGWYLLLKGDYIDSSFSRYMADLRKIQFNSIARLNFSDYFRFKDMADGYSSAAKNCKLTFEVSK
jgi:hypothetical protein